MLDRVERKHLGKKWKWNKYEIWRTQQQVNHLDRMKVEILKEQTIQHKSRPRRTLQKMRSVREVETWLMTCTVKRLIRS